MSLKLQKGPAVVAVVALGLATWSGAPAVTRAAAQTAPPERASSLDVDFAGLADDLANAAADQPLPGRTARSARRDAATVSEPKPASVQTAPVTPQPANAEVVAGGNYAGPRMARGEHRLQAPFPDHNVVVCLAGCPTGKEAIVFFEKRVSSHDASYGRLGSARVITVGMAGDASQVAAPSPSLETSNAGTTGGGSGGGVTCLAGCYSTPKSYTGRRGLELAPGAQSGRVLDGTWLTATSSGGPSTTGADVGATDVRSHTAGPEVGVTRRGQQKSLRRNDSLGSEWFTRRF